MANAHRDPKKGRALTAADFDPYEQQPADTTVVVDGTTIGLMREAFTKGA